MTKKKKNLDWYIWGEWPGIPWFHVCYSSGLALELTKYSGISLTHFAADYKEETQRVYLLKHEWEAGGMMYFNKILADQKNLIRALDIIEKTAAELNKLSRELKLVRVEVATTKQLALLCDRFHKIHHKLWSVGMVPNLLELNQSNLSGYLKSCINSDTAQKISAEDWLALIMPAERSTAQEEELSLLKMTYTISKDVKLRNLLISHQNDVGVTTKALQKSSMWPLVKKHHQKYKWLQFGWTGPDSTAEQLVGRIMALLHDGHVSQYLKNKVEEEAKLRQQQLAMLKSIRFDKRHRLLLQLLRRVLFSKVVRMDALYRGYSAFDPIFREVAKRFSLSLNQLYMVYSGDLGNNVRNNSFSSAKLNESIKYSVYIKEGNRLKFYIGKKAQKKLSPIIACLPKVKKVHEVKGECGYPGNVKGIIRFVPTSKDMHKVKKGDILLSQATDPSFLPAMEIASAFVTDLGGLTAHAAIVAREMKKPCVVGTKIATKIFKDGDRVEVDATNGLVRKIK